MVPFCEATSLCLVKETSACVKQRIIVSLALVDHKKIVETLFPELHVDWQGVSTFLSYCSHSTAEWQQIMEMLDFTEEKPPPTQLADLFANALAGQKVSIQGRKIDPMSSTRLCLAKAGLKPDWDLLCKVFLVCNLADVDSRSLLAKLLAAHGHAQVAAENVICDLSTYARHTPEEYTETVLQILDPSSCTVRKHVILQELEERKHQRDKKKKTAEIARRFECRPSLTQISISKNLEMRAKDPQDSLEAFCKTTNIPGAASIRLKQLLYYLVCLPKGLVQEEVWPTLLNNLITLKEAIVSTQIYSVDTKAIHQLLENTVHAGTPCQTLRVFKEKCNLGCGKSHMTWTTVLRLYLATYCRAEHTRELCSFVLSLSNKESWSHSISPESQNSLAAFVKEHPTMPLVELIDTLLTTY